MNIFQYLYCYLTLFSLYVMRVKCMSLDVRPIGMLFLLLYCVTFFQWNGIPSQLLSVTLLLFSEFLLFSSSNLISLNCTESSNELASTQALTLVTVITGWSRGPDICPLHFPHSNSQFLAEVCSTHFTLYYTHVPGFLVCVSIPPEPFRYILLSKFTNLWVKALGLS